MVIQLFNGWYFFWILLCAGITVALYFILRKTSPKTQKIVLFSLLAFGLLLHFLKAFIPPYSVNEAKLLRDSWFINICAANIALFPFIFLCKNKSLKDYMFYIGVISGFLAILYPTEAMIKQDASGEILDLIRFYYHHWMLIAVPLLMVLLKLHKISYKRILSAPVGLLLLMLFIMLNQIFQSELGFIPLRDGDFFDINYRNTSFIWGPGDDPIGNIFAIFCPSFFKTVPVGEFAGQTKYWPWFWLIIPAFILVTPIAFGISIIFDHKAFATDVKVLYGNCKCKYQQIKNNYNERKNNKKDKQ